MDRDVLLVHGHYQKYQILIRDKKQKQKTETKTNKKTFLLTHRMLSAVAIFP